MHNLIRAGEGRRTETPNAVMSTLASPTMSGSDALSMWKVEMKDGAKGPPHSFDSEQIWTVLRGSVTVRIGEESADLGPGDAIVIPAECTRQIEAIRPAELLVCGYSAAAATAADESQPRGTPAWIA